MKREAHESGSRGREKLRETSAAAKEGARRAKAEAKHEASAVGREAQRRAQNYASDQRRHLADRIGHYAETVHRTAEQLEEGDDPNLAHYAHLLGDRTDRVAEYVRNRSLGGVVHDAANFTRRNPEIVFGALVAAGLLLGRTARSAQAAGEEEDWEEAGYYDDDFDTEMEGATPQSTFAYADQPESRP